MAIQMTLSHLQGHSYYNPLKCDFYPRDAMLARYLLSSRDRLSVRLSQVGVVSKRLNIGSRKQCGKIAQRP